MVVVTSAAIQIGGIPIVATRSAVIQNAEIQNVVILFEAQVVTPSVALNEATPNAVLSVVQDVARGAVIPFAVDRCVVDLAAMVDSQDEDLPSDARGVSPVDLLSLVAVQSEDAPDVALLSVQAQL